MRHRKGTFSLADKAFETHEDALVRFFIEYLSKKYQFEISKNEFRFRPIGSGLSPHAKFVAMSDEVFPYFVKVGETKKIQKEMSFHNRAVGKIPPLHIPPLETVINPDTGRHATKETQGYALMAFRYISGHKTTVEPRTLFEMFPKIDTYQSVKFVDDLFQTVLFEFHGFHKEPVMKPFEHFEHTPEYFESANDGVLTTMVSRYNGLVCDARGIDLTPVLPHGYVHGDLHCENIIVSQTLSPIIIDFEMVRPEGCLLHDFAEFEVATLLSLLDGGGDDNSDSALSCYASKNIFSFFGVNQISRTIRAIRSNLGHALFNVCGVDSSDESVEAISQIYKILLMRFICSYCLVSTKSMPRKSNLLILGVFSRIFDRLYSSVIESVKQ